MSYVDMVRRGAALQASFTAVAHIPKPVVAAVTGYALGGGCELSLTADFRVCGDNAKLGQPEILLGLMPGAGGTQRLTRLVGPAVAKDIVFTGDVMNTTARIQSLCNETGVDLLVSEVLMSRLRLGDSYHVREIGVRELKGKDERVRLFTVSERTG